MSWLPNFLSFSSTPTQSTPSPSSSSKRPSSNGHFSSSDQSGTSAVSDGVSTESPGLGTSDSDKNSGSKESNNSPVARQWDSLLEHIRDGKSWAVSEGDEDAVVTGLVERSEATKTINTNLEPQKSVHWGSVEIVPSETRLSSSTSSHDRPPSVCSNPSSHYSCTSIASSSETVIEDPRPELPLEPLEPLMGLGLMPIGEVEPMPDMLKSQNYVTEPNETADSGAMEIDPLQAQSSSSPWSHDRPSSRRLTPASSSSSSSVGSKSDTVREIQRPKTPMEPLGQMVGSSAMPTVEVRPLAGILKSPDSVKIPPCPINRPAVEANPSKASSSSSSSDGSDPDKYNYFAPPPARSEIFLKSKRAGIYERAEPPKEKLGRMVGFGSKPGVLEGAGSTKPKKAVKWGTVESFPFQKLLTSSSFSKKNRTTRLLDPPTLTISSPVPENPELVGGYERAQPPNAPLGPMIGFGPMEESRTKEEPQPTEEPRPEESRPIYGYGPLGGFGPLDLFESLKDPFPPSDAFRSSIHLTFPVPPDPQLLEKPDHRFPIDMPPPCPEPLEGKRPSCATRPWKNQDPRRRHCLPPVVLMWKEESESCWREQKPEGALMRRGRTRLVYGH